GQVACQDLPRYPRFRCSASGDSAFISRWKASMLDRMLCGLWFTAVRTNEPTMITASGTRRNRRTPMDAHSPPYFVRRHEFLRVAAPRFAPVPHLVLPDGNR